MRIKHYSIFNELNKSEINWDILRENRNESQYFLPPNINEYKTLIADHTYKNIVDQAIKFIYNNKIERILSFGSGRAILEYQLKTKTNLHTTVSDISNSILKIKKFNFFDEVLVIDITKKLDLEINPNTIVILPRVDTELTDQQMFDLFKALSEKNIKHLLFIPAQLLTFKSLLIQIYIYFKALFLNKKLVDCGYSRTKYRFIKLWRNFYHIDKSYNFNFIFLKNTAL